MSWTLLAVAVVAFAFALLPTRRLFLAGWRPAPLAVYLGALVALALAAVFVRAGLRVVVPVLLVLYVLPFIGAPDAVARTVARLGGRRGGRGARRIVDGTATRVEGGPPADASVRGDDDASVRGDDDASSARTAEGPGAEGPGAGGSGETGAGGPAGPGGSQGAA